MSKRGLKYLAANGTGIANYGEKNFAGMSEEGHGVNMMLQVADVKRNLASIIKIVDDGNQVVLDSDGSYIKDKKTGRQINMRREDDGLYEFDLWIQKMTSDIAAIKQEISDRRVVSEQSSQRLVSSV